MTLFFRGRPHPFFNNQPVKHPFGGFWGSDPAFLTERAFTGHKANNTSSNDLGLIYMNARYYVGSIGRFASADTLIPDQNDPQALNRYAYARNNPLLIVDPSGHCWGFASGLRNTFYATTCNNLDMAVSIMQYPDASVGQKVAAGAYIAGEAVAHTVAVGGTIVAGVGCLTGAGTAICAGAGTAITAASADGNPTNEVAAAANVIQSVTADGDPTNEAQVLLRTVGNAQSAAMNVVRNIEKGERVGQLLDELKTLTFTTGNEHAIVRMSDGTRAMVSGGQGGINLTSEVSKVIIHTHPYQLPGTGMASPYDYQMLHQLGQFSSRILEHGNLIKFTIAD